MEDNSRKRGRPFGAAAAPTDHLSLNSEQLEAVKLLYKTRSDPSLQTLVYDECDLAVQSRVQGWCAEQGLSTTDRPLDSRYRAVWSTVWETEKGKTKRTLYQCGCGMHTKAQQGEQEVRAENRRIPYAFTGCLVHVEVTERMDIGAIMRIAGYFKHNEKCTETGMNRLPAIPLHPDVYRIALQQLTDGAGIDAVQSKNRQMIKDKAYIGMDNYDESTSNIRYHFLPSDHTSLYRQFSRLNGIDTKQQPQYNIDDWLNPDSPSYNEEVAKAIFYYSARSEAGERFKVCISTEDMTTAAWEYGHNSQIVLDGTFGVCSSRLLLFIALARNEDGKGVPLAFFLFSAPTGNKATHAGYNTAILTELLLEWKKHLEKNPRTFPGRSPSTAFEPFVAITDTDTKERGALAQVWPGIILLLCKFHLRQCWTNHRKSSVPQVAKICSNPYVRSNIVQALQSLEINLIGTVERNEAIGLLEGQRKWLAGLAVEASSQKIVDGALKHLDYLMANWLPEPLWQSWSQYGRLRASARLQIPVEGVIPTTNHLESFNGLLKRKHLRQWLHSGHRLRFDALILLLVTKILPDVYAHIKAQRDYKAWLITRFASHSTNGRNLYELHQDALQLKASFSKDVLCWWEPDDNRDRAATEILMDQRLSNISRVAGDTYLAKCAASDSRWNGILAAYQCAIVANGTAACTCPDFSSRGGACKHLRALRLAVLLYTQQGIERNVFTFPRSRQEAEALVTTRSLSRPAETLNTGASKEQTPPAPLKLSTYDLVAIQALGKDTTTLGVCDGDPDTSDDGLEDTMSLSESDSELGEGVESEPGIPEYISTVTGATTTASSIARNAAALSIQLGSRIKFESERLLPLLYGLNNLVDELENTSRDTPAPASELHELSEIITTLSGKLSRLQHRNGLCQIENSQAQTTLLPAPIIPETSSGAPEGHGVQDKTGWKKRKDRPLLRAPSPERRQKRKNSHNPL